MVIGEKRILEEANKLTGLKTNLKFIDKVDEIKFDEKTKFFLDITKGRNHSYQLSKCSSQSGPECIKRSKFSFRFS